MTMQKLSSVVATLAFLAARNDAQVIFNVETNNYDCPDTGGKYCSGPSSNFIIRCAGFVGDPEDCRNQLFGIPPLGVKGFAPCYQLNPAIGDAACSLDGIVYPENGEPFPIPADPSISATPLASRNSLNVSIAASPETADKSYVLESPAISAQVKPANNASSGRDIDAPTVTQVRVRPVPQLVAEEITTPLPFLNPIGRETTIHQSTMEAGVPVPLNGGVRALAKSNISSNALPEYAFEGTSNPSSAKREFAIYGASNYSSTKVEGTINGTGTIEKAAPTVAPYTGSANMYGVGMCAVGAGVLAVATFVLAN